MNGISLSQGINEKAAQVDCAVGQVCIRKHSILEKYDLLWPGVGG